MNYNTRMGVNNISFIKPPRSQALPFLWCVIFNIRNIKQHRANISTRLYMSLKFCRKIFTKFISHILISSNSINTAGTTFFLGNLLFHFWQKWFTFLQILPWNFIINIVIGGFNQRQRKALPPQIFLTLKFVVCIALKIIDIVANWCHVLRLKRH